MKRFWVLLTMTLTFTVATNAQDSDGGDDLCMWISADVEKKLTKKWSVEAGGEFRMKDNISAVDRFSLGVSTSYKLTKWLKADAGYDYLHTRKEGGETENGKYYNSSYWQPRHRVHVSLTESFKARRFKISLRERWVYTYTPSFQRHRMDMRPASDTYGQVLSKEVGDKCENILRLRVGLEYNIPKCKFTPFTSVEGYLSMGQKTCFGNTLKARYTVGTAYDFTKHHGVKLYYTYQDRKDITDDDDSVDSHIIGVGYSYSF